MFGISVRRTHIKQLSAFRGELDLVEVFPDVLLPGSGFAESVLESLVEFSKGGKVLLHSTRLSALDQRNRDVVSLVRKVAAMTGSSYVGCHLAVTGNRHAELFELIPVPYTAKMLIRCADSVKRLQDLLGLPVALENVGRIMSYKSSCVSDLTFLSELALMADCFVLLDVTNMLVTRLNAGIDPVGEIRVIPRERVIEYHIAGYEVFSEFAVDTHDRPPDQSVLDLYELCVHAVGMRPTILEWDENVPPLSQFIEVLNLFRRACGPACEPASLEPNRSLSLWTHDDTDDVCQLDTVIDAVSGLAHCDLAEALLTPIPVLPATQLRKYKENYMAQATSGFRSVCSGAHTHLRHEFDDLIARFLGAGPCHEWAATSRMSKLIAWAKEVGVTPLTVDLLELDLARLLCLSSPASPDAVPLQESEATQYALAPWVVPTIVSAAALRAWLSSVPNSNTSVACAEPNRVARDVCLGVLFVRVKANIECVEVDVNIARLLADISTRPMTFRVFSDEADRCGADVPALMKELGGRRWFISVPLGGVPQTTARVDHAQ